MRKVTVYSKHDCMQCNFTKKYLEDKQIAFKEYKVEENEEALHRIKAMGFQSLPVVVIEGEEPFFGFRPERLAKLKEEGQ